MSQPQRPFNAESKYDLPRTARPLPVVRHTFQHYAPNPEHIRELERQLEEDVRKEKEEKDAAEKALLNRVVRFLKATPFGPAPPPLEPEFPLRVPQLPTAPPAGNLQSEGGAGAVPDVKHNVEPPQNAVAVIPAAAVVVASNGGGGGGDPYPMTAGVVAEHVARIVVMVAQVIAIALIATLIFYQLSFNKPDKELQYDIEYELEDKFNTMLRDNAQLEQLRDGIMSNMTASRHMLYCACPKCINEKPNADWPLLSTAQIQHVEWNCDVMTRYTNRSTSPTKEQVFSDYESIYASRYVTKHFNGDPNTTQPETMSIVGKGFVPLFEQIFVREWFVVDRVLLGKLGNVNIWFPYFSPRFSKTAGEILLTFIFRWMLATGACVICCIMSEFAQGWCRDLSKVIRPSYVWKVGAYQFWVVNTTTFMAYLSAFVSFRHYHN
jgi:hypothetical protein